MSGERKGLTEAQQERMSEIMKEEIAKFLAENRREIVKRTEKRIRDEAAGEKSESAKLP